MFRGVCDLLMCEIQKQKSQRTLTVRGNHWSLLSFSMEDEEFSWSRYFIVSRGEKGNYNYHFGKHSLFFKNIFLFLKIKSKKKKTQEKTKKKRETQKSQQSMNNLFI